MEVISTRMGPDPTPLALSQEETRTQMCTRRGQTEDTRRHHLRAKEQGLRRKQTCTQFGLGLTVLNSEEMKCLSCAVYGNSHTLTQIPTHPPSVHFDTVLQKGTREARNSANVIRCWWYFHFCGLIAVFIMLNGFIAYRKEGDYLKSKSLILGTITAAHQL